MDLFEHSLSTDNRYLPLSVRMRPLELGELVGQNEIIGPGTLLRRAIENDNLFSMIFYGPPGSGKTSLASLIAAQTKAYFEELQATDAGKKDVREVLEKASDRLKLERRKTILFVDEIHAFNKSQQDVLLKAVEQGTVILIGATTENPFFEVNSPLISRSKVYVLQPLSKNEMVQVIENALSDKERGLGAYSLERADDFSERLAEIAGGDARCALNTLDFIFMNTREVDGRYRLDTSIIEEASQKHVVRYDKSGDQHYNVISAFIKSMRGSDPQAAVYWLARMLSAGEDPKFIARRLVIFASEDIGLADSQALPLAIAAFRAAEVIGMPEVRINLAHVAVYLALAPKSNSTYISINEAMKIAGETSHMQVPMHLRDASYKGAGTLGHGEGYKYPHDHPKGRVKQTYLPTELSDLNVYRPRSIGNESSLVKKWVDDDPATSAK